MTGPKLISVPSSPEDLEAFHRRAVLEIDRADRIERKRRAIELAHETSGIPKRHDQCTLESFVVTTESQRRAVAFFRDYLEQFDEVRASGRGLILVGGIGTGKTHLAVALIRALCDRGHRAGYVRLADMIRRLRETWGKESKETELGVLKKLRSLDLLVIDEVGVQYGTEAEQNHVFDVIDARYMDLKPTVVLSNCNPEELKACLGERALDRLREGGGRMLQLKGDSFRAKRGSSEP